MSYSVLWVSNEVWGSGNISRMVLMKHLRTFLVFKDMCDQCFSYSLPPPPDEAKKVMNTLKMKRQRIWIVLKQNQSLLKGSVLYSAAA